MNSPAADYGNVLMDVVVTSAFKPMMMLVGILLLGMVATVVLTVALRRVMPKRPAFASAQMASLPCAFACWAATLHPAAVGPMILLSAIALSGAVVVGVVGYFQAPLRGAIGEKRTARQVVEHGFPVITNVYLPSRNGLTQIDQIVRAGDVVVVLEVKNYSGSIKASERSRNWEVRYGRDRRSLYNPLHQNYGHVAAVKEAVGKDKVVGLVVFVGSAQFRGRKPDQVVLVSELRHRLQALALTNPATREGLERWNSLQRLAEANRTKDNKITHLNRVRKAAKPVRVEPTL